MAEHYMAHQSCISAQTNECTLQRYALHFFANNTHHILIHYLLSLSLSHTHTSTHIFLSLSISIYIYISFTHTHTHTIPLPLSQSFIRPEVLAFGNNVCLFLQILSSLNMFAYLFCMWDNSHFLCDSSICFCFTLVSATVLFFFHFLQRLFDICCGH